MFSGYRPSLQAALDLANLMQCFRRIWLLLPLAVLLFACEPLSLSVPQDAPYQRANDPAHTDSPYVLLISLDGYRHDYNDLHHAPNLEQFATEGVRAEGLIPSFPSDTFPNHYGIATGMYPGTHGIVANSFFDPMRNAQYRIGDAESITDGSWYGGTPLWVAAEAQGMVSASYFWLGSEAEIQGLRPSYYEVFDSSVPHGERIDQVLDWLSYPAEYRPHFITLYFSSVDGAGHRAGPLSDEVRNAVAGIDRDLGSLFGRIDRLDFGVNVFVVSDHGMTDLDPNRVVDINRLADLTGIRVSNLGSKSFLYINDPAREDELYRTLKAGESNYRVYRRAETPESWHSNHPRMGDLILTAAAPYSLVGGNSTFTGGGHGYDPYLDTDMHGVFFARGPDIGDRMVLPRFENIHIYPLIMELLGLEISGDTDGRLEVLEGILRRAN